MQLQGVEAQLENGGQEIQQLHDDLSQLIALTEGKLVPMFNKLFTDFAVYI